MSNDKKSHLRTHSVFLRVSKIHCKGFCLVYRWANSINNELRSSLTAKILSSRYIQIMLNSIIAIICHSILLTRCAKYINVTHFL